MSAITIPNVTIGTAIKSVVSASSVVITQSAIALASTAGAAVTSAELLNDEIQAFREHRDVVRHIGYEESQTQTKINATINKTAMMKDGIKAAKELQAAKAEMSAEELEMYESLFGKL